MAREEGEDLRSRTMSAAVWSLVRVWGARVITLVTFAVLSRLLPISAIGLLAMANVFIALFAVLVVSGASQAIVRARELDQTFLDTVFWISVGTGVLLCGVGLAVAGPVATIYHQPELAPVLRYLSLTLVLGSLNVVQNAVLTRELRFRDTATRQLSAAFAGSVVGITWALVSPSAYALVAQALTWNVVSTLVVWRIGDYRPGWHFDWTSAKALFVFGLTLTGIRGLTTVSEQGDNLVVGLFLGATGVGYYAVGYRVYQVFTELFVGALSQVAMPTFSRLQDDLPRMRRAFLEATDMSAVMAVPMFAFNAAFAPTLIPLVFGEKWAPSVPVAQIVSILGLAVCVGFFDRSILIVLGRERLELGLVAIGTVIILASVYVGQFWGVIGVAVSVVVGAYLYWPLRLLALRATSGLSIRLYLLQWIRVVVAGGVMFGCMVACEFLPLGHGVLVVMFVVGSGVYLGALRVIAPTSFTRALVMVRGLDPRTTRTAEHAG